MEIEYKGKRQFSAQIKTIKKFLTLTYKNLLENNGIKRAEEGLFTASDIREMRVEPD
jgi:hypothetical protein